MSEKRIHGEGKVSSKDEIYILFAFSNASAMYVLQCNSIDCYPLCY